MFTETVQLLARWLRHDEYGVNALVATLGRDKVDGPGKWPRIRPITIYDDATDEGTATSIEPPEVPALAVTRVGNFKIPLGVSQVKGASSVLVAVGYVTAPEVDRLAALRECGYSLRGVRLSCDRFNSIRLSGAYRAINGVQVMQLSFVTQQDAPVAVGRLKMWGFVLVQATVADALVSR